MKTTSFRIHEDKLKLLKQLSSEEQIDQSEAVRTLIELGWQHRLLKMFSIGEISLSRMADQLECSIGEAIDLLSEFGLEGEISREDIIRGEQTLEQQG